MVLITVEVMQSFSRRAGSYSAGHAPGGENRKFRDGKDRVSEVVLICLHAVSVIQALRKVIRFTRATWAAPFVILLLLF